MRGPHIVGAHREDDLAAQVADEDRGELKRERERRQEEVPEVLGHGLPEARDREPLQREAEEQDQEDPKPEVRRGEREEETDADELVGPPPFVYRGEDPEGERDDGRQAHGVGRQRERDRDTCEHEIADRLAVQQRLAHVAVRESRHEVPVLLEDRSVQAELLAKLRGLLVRRAVAQDQEGGIARKDPHHAEDHDGHAEQDEGHEDEASADVGGATHQ